MKKLIVLICMVLCVAVIGSVLAIAVHDAPDVSGSIATDAYLYLTMNSTRGTGVTLTQGVPEILPIVLATKSNDTGWTATLTIKAEAASGKSIDKVTIGFYSDIECKTAITENVTNTNGTFTLTNITEGRTVYVRLLLAANANAEEVNATSGTLTCTFAQAA